MILRKFLAGLLLTAAAFGVHAAENETPKDPEKAKSASRTRGASERTCALTITWWEEPMLEEGERLELGVQGDREVTPIHPSAMSPGGTFLYEGPATVKVVRKGLVPNPNGKPEAPPVEAWLPFVTFTVGANDQEALAILFSLEGSKKVMARTFNFNVENFPFGGFDVLNFSKTRLLCSMAGKVFYAEPTRRARSPVVISKREVVNFFMGVTEADGTQKLFYRAPLILSEKNRRLYFILDNPDPDAPNRFLAHALVQHVAGHRTVETLRNRPLPTAPAAPAAEPTPDAGPDPKKAEPKAPATGAQ